MNIVVTDANILIDLCELGMLSTDRISIGVTFL